MSTRTLRRMKLGTALAIVCAIGTAHADPFSVPEKFAFPAEAAPGAYGRFTESLFLLRNRVRSDPSDAVSWGRAVDMLAQIRRAASLEDEMRKAHAATKGERKVAVGAVLGRVLMHRLRALNVGRVVIVFGNGRVDTTMRHTKETKKLMADAIQLLEAAARANPKAARIRRELAEALLWRKEGTDAKDAVKWRNEAAAIDRVAERVTIDPHEERGSIESLIAQADAAEQSEPPEHEKAARYRCEALVRDFCNHTIPFEYDRSLFATVAQLADRGDLRRLLRRTFLDGEGKQQVVEPALNLPSWNKRQRLVRTLGSGRGENGVAALLAIAMKRQAASPLGKLAAETLASGERPYLDRMLPALFASTLHSDLYEHRLYARRTLATLIARRKLQTAQPALVAGLELDTDIVCPIGVADAIGALGIRATGALLKVARDPNADVYFRRRAVLALGKTEPDALQRIAEEPVLELHVAAARYARQPDETLRGRILGAIGRPYLTDDAAELCAQLGITEALPLLETWMANNPKHRSAPVITEAIRALRRS